MSYAHWILALKPISIRESAWSGAIGRMEDRSQRTSGRAIVAAAAVAVIASVVAISAIACSNAEVTPQPPITRQPTLPTPPPELPAPMGVAGRWRRLLWLLPAFALITALGWAAAVLPVLGWARWTLVGAALTATASIVIALLLGPGARRLAGEQHPLTAAERKQMTATERVEAVNAARHTLIQAATGLVVIGGVVFTAQGLLYTAESLETSRQAQHTAEQGQITDRYTKAVEQLGSAKLDVRLGGIYALERLAIDSPRDHPTVYDVLAAFLREHDPQLGAKIPREPATDIQAALTVIGRRNPTLVGSAINLADTHLRGANLPYANLRGAKLHYADLRGADLTGADLRGANLDSSKLRYAYLGDADLRNAELPNADLREVNLPDADLRGAFLGSADLREADLRDADLTGADLGSANLLDTNLDNANLRGADLTGIVGVTEQAIRSRARVDASTRF
ncbi:pentapeptide repeat-containing protein [Nonomuraea sp. NEAU-A123]|uniref:pentapeptide repeat-containing protein n=1 Tax=Nonomuraea sp. NEAU-A123 TaxID=2839649 RepID=UPI00203244CD|nr:pentapeptide repeat-containing protein [Nonomuraea sp. NEAU-A123]